LARVDWFRVIVDLERLLGSTAAVAERAGIPRTTLVHWRLTDSDPRYQAGEALARLWRELTSETDLPSIEVTPSVSRCR
jgi:hypothetical protein